MSGAAALYCWLRHGTPEHGDAMAFLDRNGRTALPLNRNKTKFNGKWRPQTVSRNGQFRHCVLRP